MLASSSNMVICMSRVCRAPLRQLDNAPTDAHPATTRTATHTHALLNCRHMLPKLPVTQPVSPEGWLAIKVIGSLVGHNVKQAHPDNTSTTPPHHRLSLSL